MFEVLFILAAGIVTVGLLLLGWVRFVGWVEDRDERRREQE